MFSQVYIAMFTGHTCTIWHILGQFWNISEQFETFQDNLKLPGLLQDNLGNALAICNISGPF